VHHLDLAVHLVAEHHDEMRRVARGHRGARLLVVGAEVRQVRAHRVVEVVAVTPVRVSSTPAATSVISSSGTLCRSMSSARFISRTP
jgi:hypothetical protein